MLIGDPQEAHLHDTIRLVADVEQHGRVFPAGTEGSIIRCYDNLPRYHPTPLLNLLAWLCAGLGAEPHRGEEGYLVSLHKQTTGQRSTRLLVSHEQIAVVGRHEGGPPYLRATATNRVLLRLVNDDELSSSALHLARQGGVSAVRAYVEGLPGVSQAMMVGGIADDLMNVALDLVDWQHVTEALVEWAAFREAEHRQAGLTHSEDR